MWNRILTFLSMIGSLATIIVVIDFLTDGLFFNSVDWKIERTIDEVNAWVSSVNVEGAKPDEQP